MIIGDKDIWQFGEQYIDAITGKDAMPDEIIIFKQTVEEDKITRNEAENNRLQEVKEWHLKYDPLIMKFFEIENKDDIYWDDWHLSYNLATSLFDSDGELLEKIKQTFPDH